MSTTIAAGDQAGRDTLSVISFDGRSYHYREYSYDRFDDALNYATLDRLKPGFTAQSCAPVQWKQWFGPTLAEREQMAEHGIVHEGGRYRFGPYRYDVLPDAIAYARDHSGTPPAPPTQSAEEPRR